MSRTLNPDEMSNEALAAGEQKHNSEWRDGSDLAHADQVVALAAT